jgi:hypothetical protein
MGADRGWLRLNSRQCERWRSRIDNRERKSDPASAGVPIQRRARRGGTYDRQIPPAHPAEAEQGRSVHRQLLSASLCKVPRPPQARAPAPFATLPCLPVSLVVTARPFSAARHQPVPWSVVFGIVSYFSPDSSCITLRASLPPAIRGRLSRQQEESVPPEGRPQFSCVTPRPLLACRRHRPRG